MLSPKKTQINNASDEFGQTERDDWLPVLVGSETYRLAAQNFQDIDKKLAAIQSGTRQAKQMNAAYALIDRIGPTDASTTGVEGEYSTLDNREGFIEYALSILYGAAFRPRFQVSGSSSVRNVARW